MKYVNGVEDLKCRGAKLLLQPGAWLLKSNIGFRIMYSSNVGVMGFDIKGPLGNVVEMTIPIRGESVDVSLNDVAEAICCISRHHGLEVLFNVFTAAALVLGGVTGNVVAVALGVVGAALTVVQSLVNLYLSRRRGCVPDQLSRLAAYYLYNIIASAYSLSLSCRGCNLLISSGRVYRLYSKATSSGVEISLKPVL
ncbi:MAG: hypothetical protein GSR86_06555 [Desulfurococcales archaeon]|nr:hypothetical protein [Desulfurococcales archaeon]